MVNRRKKKIKRFEYIHTEYNALISFISTLEFHHDYKFHTQILLSFPNWEDKTEYAFL